VSSSLSVPSIDRCSQQRAAGLLLSTRRGGQEIDRLLPDGWAPLQLQRRSS